MWDCVGDLLYTVSFCWNLETDWLTGSYWCMEISWWFTYDVIDPELTGFLPKTNMISTKIPTKHIKIHDFPIPTPSYPWFFLFRGGRGRKKICKVTVSPLSSGLWIFSRINKTAWIQHRKPHEVLKSSVMRGATAPLWGKDSTADSNGGPHQGPQDARANLGKLPWVAGKTSMNEDVSPIKHGDFPLWC